MSAAPESCCPAGSESYLLSSYVPVGECTASHAIWSNSHDWSWFMRLRLGIFSFTNAIKTAASLFATIQRHQWFHRDRREWVIWPLIRHLNEQSMCLHSPLSRSYTWHQPVSSIMLSSGHCSTLPSGLQVYLSSTTNTNGKAIILLPDIYGWDGGQ